MANQNNLGADAILGSAIVTNLMGAVADVRNLSESLSLAVDKTAVCIA